MAWIETAYHTVTNLDNVCCMEIVQCEIDKDLLSLVCKFSDDSDTIIWSGEDGHKLYEAMKNIAQIARGNAYISQEDIRRMLGESD